MIVFVDVIRVSLGHIQIQAKETRFSGCQTVDHIGSGLVAGIGAVAVHKRAGDGYIFTGDFPGGGVKGPNGVGDAGGSGKQSILESEGIGGQIEIQFFQR